jgi:chorismate dehydratase
MMNATETGAERIDLGSYRVGSVPYLNAAPLTLGIEDQIQFAAPSKLAVDLHAGRLDAALLSVTEVLMHPGYCVLANVGILSRGPVYSVILAHTDPLDGVREVHLDSASCTSVRLLKVLLAGRGIRPEWKTLKEPLEAVQKRNVLLIGNPAIAFRQSTPSHEIWDLGKAWQEQEGLPFVYAVWAIRRELAGGPLPRLLEAVATGGLSAIDRIRREAPEFDPSFRRAYLGGYVQYDLDMEARQGMQRFAELIATHEEIACQPVEWC